MPYPQGRSAQEDLLEAFRAGVVSRYRIEREVGRGGMATVYLAQDLKHHRAVALKVFRSDLASVLGPGRFQQEIDVAARLNHPNILPLYDSDEAGGSLYYVMPFVEGGTLRDRLSRDAQPSVAEAIGVVRQIAAGLAYAHSQGLVHRDIKPGNILLSSGHAFLADFGIAWVVREAVDTQRITVTGLVLGTPAYMPPEQLATGGRVDQRADQYALACVLYEMLLGHPPEREFRSVGAARRAILSARHDLPPEIAGALAQALSPDPERRFPDIAQFAEAIDVAVDGGPRASGAVIVRGRRVPRRVIYALLVLLPVLLVGYGLLSGRRFLTSPPARVAADTSRYAILPAVARGAAAESLNAEARLHAAFTRWDGISLVDGFQVQDAVARKGDGVMTPEVGRAIAREVGAGRYVLTSVRPVGDSLRVSASLYDVPSHSSLFSEAVTVASSQAGVDTQFNNLADLLLFRGLLPDSQSRSIGTRSLPARQAFFRGQDALQVWNLAVADSAFTLASSIDRHYAAADLWLALVRAWSGQDPARWLYAAQQALAWRTSLSARDQELAEAIAEQGRGELGKACQRWLHVANLVPSDFVGWYGTAFCLAHDDVILPDPSSPTRYAFRASYHEALTAYKTAFELNTFLLATFQNGDFQSIRKLFYTSGTLLRGGRLPGQDHATFHAYPWWEGDTLAFVPFPDSLVTRGEVPARTVATAVSKERELFHQVALTWAANEPRSAQAQEALALSLELLDDPRALDTLQHAETLATNAQTRRRITASRARLLLKYSLPDDTAQMRRGVALADSLLRSPPPAPEKEPDVVGYLAALLGRASLAADLAADMAERENEDVPLPARQTASRLVVYAGFGGPLDTLQYLEAQLLQVMNQVAPDIRSFIGGHWLVRAAQTAFPSYQLVSLDSLTPPNNLMLAERALSDRDTLTVRSRLKSIHSKRQGRSQAEFTFDRLYPEAWLLADIGDSTEAAAWLDRSLRLISAASPAARLDPTEAASLVRAMALRAQLAAGMNDTADARRWGTAVATLWQHADQFLRPVVLEMKQLGAGK